MDELIDLWVLMFKGHGYEVPDAFLASADTLVLLVTTFLVLFLVTGLGTRRSVWRTSRSPR